jgi:hypothetical protein
VALDGALPDEELPRDRAVGPPLGHQLEDLALTPGKGVERIVAAASSQHLGYDLGGEHRTSGGDASNRFAESLDLGHAVLEQGGVDHQRLVGLEAAVSDEDRRDPRAQAVAAELEAAPAPARD